MEERATRRRSELKWGLIAVGWMLYGFFFASQVVVTRAYLARPLKVGGTLAAWLICALIWFGATPFILKLARRFPLERHSWIISSLVHLVASGVFAAVLLAIYVITASLAGLESWPFLQGYRNQLVTSFHAAILTYWVMVGLTHAIDYYRKYRERELRAAQLETRLARSQLDALKMQLHPHFLFNTLNSISVLMGDDIKSARRMLTRLSELLRASLENDGAHEVSLKEELEFLTNYLEIEQTRFHDRLTVRMEIEPAALDARVPNLILQPLVENAIRHGIAPRSEGGLVEIRADCRNGMVQLQVRDNGPGVTASESEKSMKGIGLSNTRARLKQLYGPAHSFEMHEANGGGLEITIAIPFQNGAAAKILPRE